MNLRWTDAGRAALASADYVGTAALKLTHLALGDSHGAGGAADDNRTALRNERHRAALSGAGAAGKIAARADFNPDASYGITEAGIFGTVGDPPGAAFLCLYWTGGGTEAAKAAKGVALTIAAAVEFLNADADVTVEVSPDITFGNIDEATDAAFGTTRYASRSEIEDGTAGNRAIAPRGLKAAIGKVAAFLLGKAATDGTIYQLKGKADGGLLVEKRALPSASRTQKGIVELASDAEAKTGTDATRAVTPKALKAAVPALAAPTPDATTAVKGKVELATEAEAKTGTDATRAVTPRALKAAMSGLSGLVATLSTAVSSISGKTGSATTSKRGIVELATTAEAETGTDDARAVTPKALKGGLPKAIAAGLFTGTPEAGKKYVLEGVAGGKLKLVIAAAAMAVMGSAFSLGRGQDNQPVVKYPCQIDSIPAGSYDLFGAVPYDTEQGNTVLDLQVRSGASGPWVSVTPTKRQGMSEWAFGVDLEDGSSARISLRKLIGRGDFPAGSILAVVPA